MTFKVQLSVLVWEYWESRARWYNSNAMEYSHYHDWLKSTYPEIISADRQPFQSMINHETNTVYTDDTLILEFESEEHYNWFLLQQ